MSSSGRRCARLGVVLRGSYAVARHSGRRHADLATAGETPGAAQLAIRSITPNPTPALPLSVQLVLPTADRATLELVDVSGRRVLQRELNVGAGVHQVAVAGDRAVPGGIYWLRLRQGNRLAVSRVVLLR